MPLDIVTASLKIHLQKKDCYSLEVAPWHHAPALSSLSAVVATNTIREGCFQGYVRWSAIHRGAMPSCCFVIHLGRNKMCLLLVLESF